MRAGLRVGVSGVGVCGGAPRLCACTHEGAVIRGLDASHRVGESGVCWCGEMQMHGTGMAPWHDVVGALLVSVDVLWGTEHRRPRPTTSTKAYFTLFERTNGSAVSVRHCGAGTGSTRP